MTAAIEVSTRQRSLRVGEQAYSTRSAAPFRLLALLWLKARQTGSHAWVDLREAGRATGTATHARQMQRLVDFIEMPGVGLLDYATRTRGPYRLKLAPDRLIWDIDEAALRAYAGLTGPAATAGEAETVALENDILTDLLGTLLAADSAMHDGDLRRARRLAEHADAATAAQSGAASDWSHLIALREAQLDLRLGHFDAMCTRLRALETGQPAPELMLRQRLILAKSHYDRGHYIEAERLLEARDFADCRDLMTLGRFHNMRGLLAFRRWRENPGAGEEPAAHAVERIAGHYAQALLFECHAYDYFGIQATAFNLANTYLYPVRERIDGMETPAWVEAGLAWLGVSRYTCTHFFVGKDSVWGQVLALQTACVIDMPFSQINAATGKLFGNLNSLAAAARHTLEMAERIGNRFEIEAAGKIVQNLGRQSFKPGRRL